jgi:3-deoxy-manno-octulosonate cytidylyltransferase (CMP-KDO synthetase)
MRFIGIIPARMASTRFPGKPLAPIAGKPMLRHVWDAVAASKSITPFYVATDSAEIADYCEQNKITYIETARTCRNGTERCHDAMRSLAMRDPDDIVVNVQGDEPLIRPESLDALCQAFTSEVKIASLYFVPSAPAFCADRNRVKVLVGESGDALAFTRSVTASGLWKLYGQHIGVYAYRRDLLPRLVKMEPVGDLEQLAWMRERIPVRMVKIGYETVAVDRPEDVAEVEKRMHSSL